ncbi:hypothetical protein CHUAL_006673 [Chamberlinius hualienensis]
MDFLRLPSNLLLFFIVIQSSVFILGNHPPTLINDMNLALIKEDTAVGTAIYQLHGEDPEGQQLKYGLKGSDSLAVNDTTGVVYLVRKINYEMTPTLNVIVTVEDLDDNMQPKSKVETPVSLIILDVNDNSPKFAKESYDVFLTEETQINTSVLNIQVNDDDLIGAQLTLNCQIISQFPTACDLFHIKTIQASNRIFTGNLTLQQQLLYSKHPFLQFLLVSSDGTHQTSRSVTIFVSPTRVPAPLINGPFFAIINESMPTGSLVVKVNAKIPKTVKGRLAYSLLSNPQRLFVINSQNGEIRTATIIDREAMTSPVVNLKIQVQVNEDGRELGKYKPMTSEIDIKVAVKDINDHPPIFNRQNTIIHCKENINIGHVFTNFSLFVQDFDIDKSAFSIKLIDSSNYFNISPSFADEGWAVINLGLKDGPLDYENPTHRNFSLQIIATEDSTSEKFSSTSTITVYVDDENDNSPQFLQQKYTVTVKEITKANTSIANITATDIDGLNYGSSSIRYFIKGLNSDFFSLNDETGEIFVSENAKFDYETQSTYHFTYMAIDNEGHGHITLVPLTIQVEDVDDNAPIFVKNYFKGIIHRGEVQFNPPLTIQAKDVDTVSKLTYEIIGGNEDSLFKIDQETQELKSSNSSGLHLSSLTNNAKFELKVQATDGGNHSAVATVSIEIQGYEYDAPVFDNIMYNATISEMAISGTLVHQLSAKINGFRQSNITYQIIYGGRGKFRIGWNSGIVTVNKGAQFDYDKQKLYVLQIAAVDESTSPSTTATTMLHVYLDDANNKPPVLTPVIQTAHVFENAKIGFIVHKINVTDPDASSLTALKFFLQDTINSSHQISNSFNLDVNTGEIKVARTLIRRDGSEVLLNVLVVDTSAPIPQTASGAVLISLIKTNKFPPMFPPPWTSESPNMSISLVEEQPVGSIVYTFMAIDSDWDIEEYRLISEQNFLEIDKTSGVVITKSRIDYEKVPTINFTIVAIDTGVPQMSSSALVTANIININDNDPIFNSSSYKTSIKEHAAVNTYVITVSATDNDLGDFGEVSYRLLGDKSNAFTVDKEGIIRVKDPDLLDREKWSIITIYVMAEDHAEDGNQPRSTSVPIRITLMDINDHGPKFSQSEYFVSVMDNILVFPQTPILQITAKDNDDNLYALVAYQIIDGNTDGK